MLLHLFLFELISCPLLWYSNCASSIADSLTKRSRITRVQTDLQVWTIYLDTCCLSRPFDTQTQPRVIRETRAIMQILDCFREGYWHWISSEVLVDEVNRASNLEQRIQMKRWLTRAHQTVLMGTKETARAKQLETLGFKELDALHLACAESSDADIFLTTDDAILNRAKRNSSRVHLSVANPHIWLSAVQGGDT